MAINKYLDVKFFYFSGIFIRKIFFTNRRRFVKSNVKVYG